MTRHNEISLYVFDLDGTLLNTLESLYQAGSKLLTALDLPLQPKEAYRHFVGNGARVLVERLLRANQIEPMHLIEKAYPLYLDYLAIESQQAIPVYPGIEEALFTLLERQKKIAVLTNKPQAQAEFALAQALPHLSKQFSCILGTQANGPVKPDQGLMNCLLAACQSKAEDAVMIGDSDVDVSCGALLGHGCWGCAWGFRGEEELKKAGARRILHHARELLD